MPETTRLADAVNHNLTVLDLALHERPGSIAFLGQERLKMQIWTARRDLAVRELIL